MQVMAIHPIEPYYIAMVKYHYPTGLIELDTLSLTFSILGFFFRFDCCKSQPLSFAAKKILNDRVDMKQKNNI